MRYVTPFAAMVIVLAGWPASTAAQDAVARPVVIVHGAWGGGWDWKNVEMELRARGHVVYRPTLTGLGERNHLASADIGLATHVTDVVNVIVWEQLEDVVLVGHSYGGMVITGVAEQVAERIGHLVYLDAFLPFDGECAMAVGDGDVSSCKPLKAGDMTFARLSDGLLIPSWLAPGARPPSDVPHPAKTLIDPLDVRGAPGNGRPASYIVTRTAPGENDDFDGPAARARELGWPVLEMIADHNPQRAKPRELAELVLRVSAGGS